MRIIAGRHKGRTLKAPKWEGLRPTSDKLRETLFNILAPRIERARVLDLFAGTGAVALEALSRGAASATCVDSDRRAARFIAENAAACGETNRCVIIRDRAEHALHSRLAGKHFDVVVLDPPYDAAAPEPVLEAALRCLAPDGLLVLEHAFRRAVPAVAGARVTRTVRSGDSALTLFEVQVDR